MIIKDLIIPAIRGFKELEMALEAPQEVIFLLEGELIHLQSIVNTVKRANKKYFSISIW